VLDEPLLEEQASRKRPVRSSANATPEIFIFFFIFIYRFLLDATKLAILSYPALRKDSEMMRINSDPSRRGTQSV
jgi:hypothetical protein